MKVDLSGTETDWSGIMGAGLTFVGKAASGDLMGSAGAALGVASAVYGGGQPQGSRPCGGVASMLDDNFTLRSVFKPKPDIFPARMGYPLCKTRYISALGGYIVVHDPHVAITGTQAEANMVESYLANGFYNE